MQDLTAWTNYVLSRPDVDPARVGIFGASMGGALAIEFAAMNAAIKAVVAASAFSSLPDTVNTSVTAFTGLPPYPFAPMIVFWSEREAGYRVSEIDARARIAEISPRPVLIMQGGADRTISADSGQRLYDAARAPRELWFEPALDHLEFLAKRPAEFERRVVAFYERSLLKF